MKKSKMRVLFVVLAMLVATLSACSANVSFKINFEVDGVQYGSIDTGGGAAIALPADPTKTGYTFDGWYFDKDVWQQPLTIHSFLHAKLTSNLTVYAKWLEKFDVIFEANGGSAVDAQKITDGSFATVPTAPTKTKFSFVGWYKEAGCTTAFDFATEKITANTTVYAKWLEKFDVIFEVNGGSVVAAQSVIGGSFATVPTAPTKTKFSFVGWYKEAGCTTAFDFATEKITANTTVYAKWLEKFDVIFEANGGSAVAPQSVVGGSFATVPTAPTKANDFFEGWYNADMTTQFNFAAEITADTTVYAKWTGCAIDTFLTFTFIDNTNQAYSVAQKQGAVVPDILVLPTEYNLKPVVAIDIGSFFQCNSIKSATISASITNIGIGAFAFCSSLTSIEVDPANPNFKSIDGNLYSKDGSSLRQYVSGKKEPSFAIPSHVTTIGGGAFVGCSALTSITIPTGVTTIEDLAFLGCIALTSITIPSNVTSIGFGAFGSCFRLASFEVDPANQNYQSIGGNLYSKDGTTLVQYVNSKAEASFAIPSQVTTIGDSAFEACNSLISMTIPSSVVSIGSGAFLSCLNLASVTFETGSRLTTIGNSAFANCSSLTSITIPLSVQTIGGMAFANCSVLKIYAEVVQKPSGWDNNWKDSATQVVFDSTNNEAKNYEYTTQNNAVTLTKYNGSGLKIIIPAFMGGNVVVDFGEIFKGNTTMQSVQIPQGVTTIAAGAFLGCSRLTSIEVDTANQNFKSLDGNLYNKEGTTLLQCASGKKDGGIGIPQGVTTIGSYAFSDCNSLRSVTIPQTVTTIGNSAFANCSSLQSITIPQTVTTIGNSAFANCSNLQSVTIPLSVQTIGSYAFQNCSNLTIEAEALSPQIGWAANWNHNCPVNYKPTGRGTTADGLEYTFDAANQVTITRYIGTNTAVAIPATIDGKTVVSIDGGGFQGCSNLASVNIPSSIINIGGAVFGGCSGLKNITFEAGSKLTTIGPEAFAACGLTNITLPASVITIGTGAFAECSGLKNITFEAGSKLTTIGEGAFMGCGFANITIPASVSTIAMGAFINCSSLMSIEVERGNPNYQSIDGNLYSIDGTTLLQYACGKAEASFAIPSQVTTIGDYAFAACGLTNITLPASVITIGTSAFAECRGLKNITFEAGSKLTTIGPEAFTFCGFTNITFEAGSKLTTIGEGAFMGCNLTRITIPASVTTIAMGSFIHCSSLMSIEVERGNPNYQSIDGNLYSIDGTTLLQYACGKKATSFAIPSQVTTIGGGAFASCSLTGITIPAQVTTIGWAAFLWCSNLASVTFAAGSRLTTIEGIAFSGCSSLTSITIPASVVSMGLGAFQQCSNLASVTFEAGSRLTTIGNSAFANCSSLQSITIPSGVVSIGDYAFQNCSGLISAKIPKSVTTIGRQVISNCNLNLIIYVEVQKDPSGKLPSGWASDCVPSGCDVRWGQTM